MIKQIDKVNRKPQQLAEELSREPTNKEIADADL